MADRDDPFLRRWSRRKRGGGATPVAEADTPPPLSDTEPKRKTAAPTRTEDEAPDLPDIESLDKDSDYTAFLRKGVSEQIKRQALRKLWRSDPLFAILDGLNDYDEDFSLAFTDAVTKTVKTAYKVGKGFVDDDETAEEAETAEGADTTEEADTEDGGPVAAGEREDDGEATEDETADADAEKRGKVT